MSQVNPNFISASLAAVILGFHFGSWVLGAGILCALISLIRADGK